MACTKQVDSFYCLFKNHLQMLISWWADRGPPVLFCWPAMPVAVAPAKAPLAEADPAPCHPAGGTGAPPSCREPSGESLGFWRRDQTREVGRRPCPPEGWGSLWGVSLDAQRPPEGTNHSLWENGQRKRVAWVEEPLGRSSCQAAPPAPPPPPKHSLGHTIYLHFQGGGGGGKADTVSRGCFLG